VVYGKPRIVHAWATDDGIHVVLSMPFDQQRGLEIYDAAGKLTWQTRVGLTEGSNQMFIPGRDHGPGIYMIRSDGPGGVLVRKIAVM
jgi:hypothetical protein